MKRTIVLAFNENGTITTGQKDGDEPAFPCLDLPQEQLADKLVAPVVSGKNSTWCG
jgi:hypothetical protein